MTGIDKSLLWVDDDGKGRYLSVVLLLKREGWLVEWAKSGEEAIKKLCQRRFTAVLLDQVFALQERHDEEDIWAGTRVLHWLRGRSEAPEQAPVNERWERFLARNRALEHNQAVPVCIISAFMDARVEAAAKEASEQDREMKLLRKPIGFADIEPFLEAIGV